MSCRVLIVDDDPDYGSALAVRLGRRGFVAAVADGGAKALDVAQGMRPDVILLDVCMPELDGIALLGRLKREHPQVPVILVTGHASVASGIDGMRLGAFDYLTKPVEIEALCARIQAAYEQRLRSE